MEKSHTDRNGQVATKFTKVFCERRLRPSHASKEWYGDLGNVTKKGRGSEVELQSSPSLVAEPTQECRRISYQLPPVQFPPAKQSQQLLPHKRQTSGERQRAVQMKKAQIRRCPAWLIQNTLLFQGFASWPELVWHRRPNQHALLLGAAGTALPSLQVMSCYIRTA